MEIFRAFAIGVLAGAIYVWPFAACRSYKRLVLSGVRQCVFRSMPATSSGACRATVPVDAGRGV
jgi:hypothetical protein